MTTQPEALRLADVLMRNVGSQLVNRKQAAAELRRLHTENEALKSELRMEQTISFRVQMQQYAAQRDALLEALKEIAYAAECVETGRPGDCDIDYPSWFAKARAAIAKARAE